MDAPMSLVDTSLLHAEEALLSNASVSPAQIRPVFILGAPRTGSTLLYQAMAHSFGLSFISNLTNSTFPDTPIIGLAIQKGLNVEISFESAFGKTHGPFQPSEGSAVMSRWFGGGHPSQVVSTRIRDGKEAHFRRTLAAAEAICAGPLMIKNAWHCFRIPYLAGTLAAARFVWARRDIRRAASSDLEARYLTKGDGNAWNSATPANVETLRRLPPPGQVVENQFEFNSAIETTLTRDASGRWMEVWYEDFIAAPDAVLSRIGTRLGFGSPRATSIAARKNAPVRSELDREMVCDYVDGNMERLRGHLYPERKGIT